jgi:hypothetical protein
MRPCQIKSVLCQIKSGPLLIWRDLAGTLLEGVVAERTKVFVWCFRRHTEKVCLECSPTAPVPQNHHRRLRAFFPQAHDPLRAEQITDVR